MGLRTSAGTAAQSLTTAKVATPVTRAFGVFRKGRQSLAALFIWTVSWGMQITRSGGMRPFQIVALMGFLNTGQDTSWSHKIART